MGKGSQSTSVQIPQWLEDAAKQNLARADEIARIGYVPRFGPEVAAFSPMQEAAFANTGRAASAFGMGGGGMTGMEGMPAPETYAGGVRGYSSYPMYQDALAQLQANAPGQYEAIRGMFINPVTGAQPTNPAFAQPVAPAPAAAPVLTDEQRRIEWGRGA